MADIGVTNVTRIVTKALNGYSLAEYQINTIHYDAVGEWYKISCNYIVGTVSSPGLKIQNGMYFWDIMYDKGPTGPVGACGLIGFTGACGPEIIPTPNIIVFDHNQAIPTQDGYWALLDDVGDSGSLLAEGDS